MIFEGIIFVFGLCVGSFLNSFLWRYQEKKSFAGRSVCPNCNQQIAWYDNIPLVSWIILRGKCRHCRKPISLQYPLIELLTALLFLLIAVFTPFGQFVSASFKNGLALPLTETATLILAFLITAVLIVISVYDAKTQEMPNGFNLLYILSCLGFLAVSLFAYHGIANPDLLLTLSKYLLAAAVSFAVFFALYFFSKETWMGGGDAKFIFGTGLLLGPAGTFLAIFLASVFGSIYGLLAIALKKLLKNQNSKSRWFSKIKNLKSEIPFGPFLALGTYLGLVFGPQLLDIYAKIFLGYN